VLVALEDAEPVRRRDADALIADGDRRARRDGPHREPDGAPLPELEGVREQVRDDLLDRRRIPPAVDPVGRAGDRHALRPGEGMEQPLHRRPHGGADVDVARLQRRSARALQLGHRVDQGFEALNLGSHDGEGGRYGVGGEAPGVALCDADVEKRSRHRRAQLVANQLHGVAAADELP